MPVRGSSQLLAGVRPYRLQRLLQSRSMTVTIFLGNMRWWKKRSKRIGCEKNLKRGEREVEAVAWSLLDTFGRDICFLFPFYFEN